MTQQLISADAESALMTVQTLHVALNERSYPIYIGGDLSLITDCP